jgi:hypothetical protein
LLENLFFTNLIIIRKRQTQEKKKLRIATLGMKHKIIKYLAATAPIWSFSLEFPKRN